MEQTHASPPSSFLLVTSSRLFRWSGAVLRTRTAPVAAMIHGDALGAHSRRPLDVAYVGPLKMICGALKVCSTMASLFSVFLPLLV